MGAGADPPEQFIYNTIEPQPKAPSDLRFPELRRNKMGSTSTSTHSSSPRKSQYAYTNMEMAARESYSRTLGPSFPETRVLEESPLQGILPDGVSWGFSGGLDTDFAPVGMNPIINNNIANLNAFDTDMSDNTGPSQQDSNGLTPRSSNSNYQASSNTSYSPPQVQDEDATTMVGIAAQQQQQQQQRANSMGSRNDPFKIPPGWEMNSRTGTTPGFTGMSPGGEWDKMMQGMGWDQGTGMTPK